MPMAETTMNPPKTTTPKGSECREYPSWLVFLTCQHIHGNYFL